MLGQEVIGIRTREEIPGDCGDVGSFDGKDWHTFGGDFVN